MELFFQLRIIQFINNSTKLFFSFFSKSRIVAGWAWQKKNRLKRLNRKEVWSVMRKFTGDGEFVHKIVWILKEIFLIL